jgi:hypothetical protein
MIVLVLVLLGLLVVVAMKMQVDPPTLLDVFASPDVCLLQFLRTLAIAPLLWVAYRLGYRTRSAPARSSPLVRHMYSAGAGCTRP